MGRSRANPHKPGLRIVENAGRESLARRLPILKSEPSPSAFAGSSEEQKVSGDEGCLETIEQAAPELIRSLCERSYGLLELGERKR